MPTVTELANPRPRGLDGTGKKTRVRRFHIDVSTDSAIESGLLNGLPAPNTGHPDDPSLILESYSVTSVPENPNTSYIEAAYSNFRAFRFPSASPRLDPSEPEFAAEGGGSVEVEQAIPYAVRVQKEIRQGDANVIVPVWEPREALSREYRDSLSYSAVVQTFTSAERNAIRGVAMQTGSGTRGSWNTPLRYTTCSDSRVRT